MDNDDLSAADPLGQIADEFVEALRQGQRPSVEEFARRYPKHADEIRDMLPALVLMEKAKAPDETSGEGGSPAAPAAAAPLQQLGDYQLLREVGRGGDGGGVRVRWARRGVSEGYGNDLSQAPGVTGLAANDSFPEPVPKRTAHVCSP